jgi:glycerol-3-phosphate acyltransferase PlsX
LSDTHTIVVDAMGGDHAPAEPVRGAVLAASDGVARVLLAGDPDAVGAELARHDTGGLAIDVVPSEGFIEEGEHPIRAMRAKPRSSIATAVGLVKAGKADAFVSMGSTGGSMAAAVIALGKFAGLERPTLGGPFLSLAPKTTVIDLGANVDCKPSQLLSFGALGASFHRFYHQTPNPRVALLSVGAEESKGSKQVQEAHALFKASGLNFVGNVEGHELFADKADVVVCDGFVGNVLLKFTEGLAEAAAKHLARELGPDSEAVRQISGLAGMAEQGGGPLFGINGVGVVGHGRSSGEGIATSIRLAVECLERDLVSHMRDDLAEALRKAGADEEKA